MYHFGLLDTVRNQLCFKQNESVKLFLGSLQNFPDLKNHIRRRCQEEGPNYDAELISEAATALLLSADATGHQRLPPKPCFWGLRVLSSFSNFLDIHNIYYPPNSKSVQEVLMSRVPVMFLISSLQGSLITWHFLFLT